MSHAANEVYAGRLIGRRVRDTSGARIGRIADIIAKREGDEIVVTEYLVGPHAWLHRFAIHGLGLRLRNIAWRYRVSWDLMDLSDPRQPQVTCTAGELPIEYLPPRKRGLKRRPAHRMA